MLFAIVMILIAAIYVKGHPVVKHFLNYRKEREELCKRHSRLCKARTDLLVS